MKLRVVNIILSVACLSVFGSNAAFSQPIEDSWQNHYQKAELAYARHNLFVARHEFSLALKEAEECKQHHELTTKLEGLASRYIAAEQHSQAEPLLKLARKLKAKFARTS